MNAVAERTLSDPAAVERRLEEIEAELAQRQNDLEDAAMAWFQVKRESTRDHAEEFVKAEGSVAERNATADIAVMDREYATSTGERLPAWEAEGRFEAMRMKVRVLDTRAAIGMSILRAQSRAA